MFSKKKIQEIRDQFPILKKKIYSNSLVYIDNAATTQKPFQVIKASEIYYSTINSNVHRGLHFLSQESTFYVENVRKKIQKFIHAKHSSEIIFTKGTTESINLVASSISFLIKKGDEIIISYLEHHSNIVPWQILCSKKKALLKIIPINKDGLLQLEYFNFLISEKTKIVAINHVSNVLGIINPVKNIIDKSHEYGALVLIDGAQVPSSLDLDVQNLNVDFYVFSAHKMYGPTGIGILYGKEKILNYLDPYQTGGEMINKVSFDQTTYSDLPFKFEAGTPNIEGIIVWGEAIDFVEKIGVENIQHYKKELLSYAIKLLSRIDGIQLYGGSDLKKRSSIISFNLSKLHCFDVGSILDRFGIAVRTGHLCAQPLMNFFNVKGMIRASFSIYNTFEEIDYLFDSILKAKKFLLKH
ncbi:aminotransferase class V-fold PLP-dependent enzyme [Blattabacterium punctulatus]|uniref:Cysteine desulfurase n=1 Tax=Blattabacterium punctulatus TaxID=164514 RepID=A0ABN5M161_9FLAO|nr:SufS family cysteine desulfurase [Blattabacterium punctulatus]AWU39621.1 cysteine desulfurase CsdA [Blattabacterium punctulatus]AWU40166.1 cysteine desulfurase CsdA [Blattabacterium punctulatus]AWU42421.1 cysteine desulfurase CsdA [Blattabacterium punctulatus]AWU42963.1 cysteine desulfurase CsdA [Blattabacterium punctulatus]AWU45700.1 cysteine desulfurase CsdA [Blattabacterium punctulatus]